MSNFVRMVGLTDLENKIAAIDRNGRENQKDILDKMMRLNENINAL